METATETKNTAAPDVITRAEYLRRNTEAWVKKTDAAIAHREYYGQFVTEKTQQEVERFFGIDALVKAGQGDVHLNTIPLSQWDRICWINKDGTRPANGSGAFFSILAFNRDAATAAGETITRAVLVGIAKAAAHQLIERHTLAN